MTVRVYLAGGRVAPGPPQPGDLPAERFFVHASEVPEVWVETESTAVPERGRAVAFALVRPMELGFERVTGTIERAVSKRSRARVAREVTGGGKASGDPAVGVGGLAKPGDGAGRGTGGR